MIRSKLTPAIPARWMKYIKSHVGRYAIGTFSAEDAEQVAYLAFLKAKMRFKPGKGEFERYAKASIRHALLNARGAEQKHWDNRESSEVEYMERNASPPWAGEEMVLDAIEESARAERVMMWADRLPPKVQPVWQGLYLRDLSQRELAAESGVSQARISQRNGKFIALARAELFSLRHL